MTNKLQSLSIQQARKLVLLSQHLPPAKQTGNAVEATLGAVEHLGYIQIDTISAVQRAHHHTLWNRNARYRPEHLDQLLDSKQIFEYWSHAAAYLPMRDYRFSLIRKKAIANGSLDHWYQPNKALMQSILNRIEAEGPLMAKDFVHNGKKVNDWGGKPAKQALEHLFMQGELMISKRINFHKVFDLTERVIPKEINTNIPTQEEYAHHLIKRYLFANGLGQASEISYLLKNTKTLISKHLQEMTNNGGLIQISVNNSTYYAIPESLELLKKPLAKSKVKILSPFDNLLIQRKRMLDLFDFDYQIECYVPEKKRKYGYFSLPILWNGSLVARMDCRVDRKKSLMHINHLALESTLKNTDAFTSALFKELPAFLNFNACSKVHLHRTTPSNYYEKLKKAKIEITLE